MYAVKPDSPQGEEITKTAIGAEESVEWEYYIDAMDAIERLKKEGRVLVALEQTKTSIDYRQLKTNQPLCLVVGNEIEGVDPNILKQCDHAIEIPMRGSKQSLNVSVAFGIAAYQLA
ncbi:hypothetical protein IPJ72_03895 [Candidatus Peregrinibacteria bacterium]|nr:MAG: hypothetical protein IPJ72_03895 [Candidatus Peregrinibacteria bacterium]